MNRFEIRDILNQHKEHFRVLPTLAHNALNDIIEYIDDEEKEAYKATVARLHAEDEAAKKKSPAASFTVGKSQVKDHVNKKAAKKVAKKKGK